MFAKLRSIAELYLLETPHSGYFERFYAAFRAELGAQLERIAASGFRFEVSTADPFKTSAQLFADIDAQKTVVVFGDADLPTGHPLAEDSGYLDCNGRPLLWNHVFRICHDFYGHYSGRNTFSARGEVAAFRVHAAMFTTEALPALAAETVCQVAVFYARPELWRPDGTLPRPGDPDFVPLPQRAFAPQKPAVIAGADAVKQLLHRSRLSTAIAERIAYAETATPRVSVESG